MATRRIATAVAHGPGNPRRRQIDLASAATARMEEVPYLTEDVGDCQTIDDLL